MENKDKVYTEGIKPEGKFYKWFDNYWYHYKWVTIGVVFLIVVFLVCTLQTCEKKREDTTVLYAGPYQLSANEVENIRGVLNTVMPYDFDENGEKYTSIVEYLIYSEEQIKAIEAQTDEKGISVKVNRNHISQNFSDYSNYLLNGETTVCFLDPSLYYSLVENNRLEPVVTALGTDSGYESDVYGIVLGKTEIYESYSALRVLPEDTVICILRSNFVGKNSNETTYKNDLNMFKAIVNYSSKEK